MDREIKFRLIENGKVVGHETHELDTPCGTINIYHKGMNIEAVEGVYISHDSKEQFTGLKDKNGVESYYQDKAEYIDEHGMCRTGIIELGHHGWYLEAIGGDDEGNQDIPLYDTDGDFKVIGTIHDKEQQ